MAGFIIDSSLAAAWCFPDEGTDYTNGVLQALSGSAEAIAPRLWAHEVRNSVLMGVRRKRITVAEAKEFLVSLVSLPIRLGDPSSYDAVFDLARSNGLTVYDAAYLDLALREGLPLASLDAALLRAAEESGAGSLSPSHTLSSLQVKSASPPGESSPWSSKPAISKTDLESAIITRIEHFSTNRRHPTSFTRRLDRKLLYLEQSRSRGQGFSVFARYTEIEEVCDTTLRSPRIGFVPATPAWQTTPTTCCEFQHPRRPKLASFCRFRAWSGTPRPPRPNWLRFLRTAFRSLL